MSDLEKSTRLKNHYIIHIAFYAFMFNLLPVVFIGTNMSGFILYMLLLGFPALIYVASIIFALYNRFKWIYILFPTALFIPAAFIYYNYTALVYAILYASSAALGMLVGIIFIWIFTKKPAVAAGSLKIKSEKKNKKTTKS
ncbi:MAG: hypothetical protein WC332_03965 [Clostridia bacterium]